MTKAPVGRGANQRPCRLFEAVVHSRAKTPSLERIWRALPRADEVIKRRPKCPSLATLRRLWNVRSTDPIEGKADLAQASRFMSTRPSIAVRVRGSHLRPRERHIANNQCGALR